MTSDGLNVRDRLIEAIRNLDSETLAGDLSARMSTSPEQWADTLLSNPYFKIVDRGAGVAAIPRREDADTNW